MDDAAVPFFAATTFASVRIWFPAAARITTGSSRGGCEGRGGEEAV